MVVVFFVVGYFEGDGVVEEDVVVGDIEVVWLDGIGDFECCVKVVEVELWW